MADETKRVIDQTTDSSLSAGDFVIIDSQSEGTRKFDLGTELTGIKEDLAELEGGGLSDDAKQALLACFQHIAFLDDDEDYYQNLYDALYSTDPPTPPTPATLVSISAVYTQSGTVYDTDTLNRLKTDLVVTAHYSDSTTATVTTYTLSGTLTEGTSTITVSYGGETTTFTVNVTLDSRTWLYRWDLTRSLIDSVSNNEITLTGATQDASGLHFTGATQIALLSNSLDLIGKTIELDIANFDFKGDSSKHVRLLMMTNAQASNEYGTGPLIFRSGLGWSAYGWVNNVSGSNRSWASTGYGNLYASDKINAFNGKTVKIELVNDYTFNLYIDDTLIGSISGIYLNNANGRSQKVVIGGLTNNPSAANGDQCYDMTITGIRIYQNE